MELHKITTIEDVEVVKSFFYQIFPEETEECLVYFEKAIKGDHSFSRLEYYLCYEIGLPVGVTGVYANDTTECWLGWFGIRPEFRRRGYATNLLDKQLQMMKDYGYKVCRIYTDKVINKNALDLYLKKGFVVDSEYEDNIITLSKSLDGKTIPSPWKGEPLGFLIERINY